MPERGTEPPLWWAGVAAAVLRSFARSRGESICEATISRTFAEPTTIDLGRGFRVAVLSGLRGTACVVPIAFGLGGPTTERGRVALLTVLVLRSVAGVLVRETVVSDNFGVAGLEAVF